MNCLLSWWIQIIFADSNQDVKCSLFHYIVVNILSNWWGVLAAPFPASLNSSHSLQWMQPRNTKAFAEGISVEVNALHLTHWPRELTPFERIECICINRWSETNHLCHTDEFKHQYKYNFDLYSTLFHFISPTLMCPKMQTTCSLWAWAVPLCLRTSTRQRFCPQMFSIFDLFINAKAWKTDEKKVEKRRWLLCFLSHH